MALPIDICCECGKVMPKGRHICKECEQKLASFNDCTFLNENYCILKDAECVGHECESYICSYRRNGE